MGNKASRSSVRVIGTGAVPGPRTNRLSVMDTAVMAMGLLW